MKKAEILKGYRIYKLDDVTVFISNRYFNFSFTVSDSIVKDEYKGQYKYFGGLQCDYSSDSIEFKNLEQWLCEIAEIVLAY